MCAESRAGAARILPVKSRPLNMNFLKLGVNCLEAPYEDCHSVEAVAQKSTMKVVECGRSQMTGTEPTSA